jgi:cytochrome P450
LAYEDHSEVHGPVMTRAINSGTPHHDYVDIAAQCPVLHNRDGSVTLTRLPDIRALHRLGHVCAQGLISEGVGGSHRRLIPLDLDGPEHTRFRRILDPLFSPRRMAAREPEFFQLANDAIDGFVGDGEGDLYETYCKYVPAVMFLRLMGLPESDAAELLIFNDAQLRTDPALSPGAAAAHRERVTERFYGYIDEAIDKRLREPAGTDDILGHLTSSEVGGRRLAREEIVDVSFLLMIAGLDTVASNLANAIVRLADRLDLRRQLLDDPGLWNTGVEELIRFESVVTFSKRASRYPVQVGGETIAPLTTMYMSWPSGNLDAASFDDPLSIDLARSPNAHIAFGLGQHRCLGSHLARMELRSGLRAFLTRIPDYHLVNEPDFRTGGNPRSPKRIYVAWPARPERVETQREGEMT